jgi:hypothetical protein
MMTLNTALMLAPVWILLIWGLSFEMRGMELYQLLCVSHTCTPLSPDFTRRITQLEDRQQRSDDDIRQLWAENAELQRNHDGLKLQLQRALETCLSHVNNTRHDAGTVDTGAQPPEELAGMEELHAAGVLTNAKFAKAACQLGLKPEGGGPGSNPGAANSRGRGGVLDTPDPFWTLSTSPDRGFVIQGNAPILVLLTEFSPPRL